MIRLRIRSSQLVLAISYEFDTIRSIFTPYFCTMTLHRTGFTLVELMIVIAIVGIIAAAIYPAMSGYYARGRDVGRISDIKDISARFQDYTRTNSSYPSNISKDGDISYCVSTIRGWTDAVAGFRDKQFSQLGGTGALHSDPSLSNQSITTLATLGCSQP